MTTTTLSVSDERSELDRTKHRSTSVDSLFSIENSVVKCDDLNRICLDPIAFSEYTNSTDGRRTNYDVALVARNFDENNHGRGTSVGLNIDFDDVDSVVSESEANDVESNSDDNEDAKGIGFDAEKVKSCCDLIANNQNEPSKDQSYPKISDSRIITVPAFASLVPSDDTLRDMESNVPIDIKIKPSTASKVSRNELLQTEEDDVVPVRDICARNSVRFGSVEVHTHDIGLGGSAVPMRGPSLSLKWERMSYQKFVSVDEHQKENPWNRRPPDELLLTSVQRIDMFLDRGYSMREIRLSIRESGCIRAKRIQSTRFSSRNNFLFRLSKKIRASLKSKLSSMMNKPYAKTDAQKHNVAFCTHRLTQ